MSPPDRLEAALETPEAFDAAQALVVELRDRGMPQKELFQLFDEARQRHHHDSDERRYDAILDMMDVISGWCVPSRRLYPDS